MLYFFYFYPWEHLIVLFLESKNTDFMHFSSSPSILLQNKSLRIACAQSVMLGLGGLVVKSATNKHNCSLACHTTVFPCINYTFPL